VGYYMGDYYAGDPGFFSFLGKVAKTAVGFIPGVGGIGGKLLGAGAGALAKVSKSRVGRTIIAHPVLSAAGAAGVAGMGAGVMGSRMGTPAAAGAASHMRRMRGAGGGFRRHRRMRVTNPKALRRAIRRTTGFAKLAMKTIHLIHPKKHVRFGGFKKKRRK
jgi:hypothetical protein